MASQTLYKQLMNDPIFNKYTQWLKANQDNAMVWHGVHKQAFEVSLLVMPHVRRIDKNVGDGLLSMKAVSELGLVYFTNLLSSLQDMKNKPVKRMDKLVESLLNLRKECLILKEDVERALDIYINGGKPTLASLRETAKRATNIRRNYYRLKEKIDTVEKNVKFDEYKTSSFVKKMFNIYQGNIPKTMFSLVASHEKKKKMLKKKEDVEVIETEFSYKYGLPAIAILKAAKAKSATI
ncbi:MAG: hypothetical protein ACTSVF_05180 [Candidatus Asgardarchaeia archaeon]